MSQPLYLFVCEYQSDLGPSFVIVSSYSTLEAIALAIKDTKCKEVLVKTIGVTTSHPSNNIIYRQELTPVE